MERVQAVQAGGAGSVASGQYAIGWFYWKNAYVNLSFLLTQIADYETGIMDFRANGCCWVSRL
jgi:hypothetical protein